MTTTLGYALLSLLARGNATGYDLVQRMHNTIGHCWQAQHSQIYPELARLEASGLVVHERVEQSVRPAKKVYTLTEQGLQALRAWVVADTPISPRRDELTVKSFSLWLADLAQATELFRQHATAHRAQQAYFEHKLAALTTEHGDALRTPDQPLFGMYIALHRGISAAREAAEWCEWVVTTVQSTPPTPS